MLSRFRAALAKVSDQRRQRDADILHVKNHPEDFLGGTLTKIIDRCGPPDSQVSFDFGHSVATWEGAQTLTVTLQGDTCTAIE